MVLTLSISACTPPMPPEFQAELAERYVTCVSGEIAISTVPELAEITQAWVDGLSENCSDLSATIIGAVDESEIPVDELKHQLTTLKYQLTTLRPQRTTLKYQLTKQRLQLTTLRLQRSTLRLQRTCL